MAVSVILPNYNRAKALGQTLQGLTTQTTGAASLEVIVVDDGSTDGSIEVVQGFERTLQIRLLRQANQGAGAARNLGARHASGELLIFLDADMIPAPGLVEAYTMAFLRRPDAVHIGRIMAWPEAFQTLFDQVTRAEMTHDLGPAPRHLVFYNLASGNFAIGADTFQRLGGFDEALRMTEDMDLGYRAHQAGVPLQYCPEAVGQHNHPKTLDQRCKYVEHGAFWTAHLLAKHPKMAPQLPIYQDILPLRPAKDPLRLTVRKLGRRVLALRFVYGGLRRTIGLMERHCPSVRALRSLYYKAMSARRVSGFRQGWQEITSPAKRAVTAALSMLDR